MNIGVIGTGNVGGVLARKLRVAGHEVRVANSRGIEGVRAFAEEIGAMPVDTRGAVEGVDAVILSIPFAAVADLPKGLFDGLPRNVPVIDTGNYYPDMRDPRISEIDEGMAESVWVSRQLGRPIIKAFNNILAYSLAELGQPRGSRGRLAIAVAGDDAKMKALVSRIVDQVGFDAVDAGALADSWRQQPSTPAYCCDYDAGETRQAFGCRQAGCSAGETRQDDGDVFATRSKPLARRHRLVQPGDECYGLIGRSVGRSWRVASEFVME